MPPKKLKPPTETRQELLTQVANSLESLFAGDGDDAIAHLLEYFTNVDLVAIRDDLNARMME